MSSESQILHSVSCCCFPFFPQSILATVQNDDWRKKIKAISCELSVISCQPLPISCELTAEAYFPLVVIRNISKGFAVVVRKTLNVIRSKCEESITVVRKTVRRHQRHRFFTPCHCSVSRFSLKAFSTPFRMTLEGKSVIIKGTLSVIQSASEESMPVVRKTVRRHQRNRFFTLCHCPVSRLSHKAFLPPF